MVFQVVFQVVLQVVFQAEIFTIESPPRIREADDCEPLLIEGRQAKFPVLGLLPRSAVHKSEPHIVCLLQRGELHVV